ncbi:phospholipase D-like domain-containing protein [Comamonas sp. JC664]|uniref:phospholipase D-like domain-containing protein n=1 Tax=Comamonas sp. JC664 TaxID=2801917 RepID=UPI003605DDC5
MPAWAGQLLASMELDAAQPNAKVVFHQDGLQALQQLLRLIEQAQRNLDLCTYVFARRCGGAPDWHGAAAGSARGVRVRLLLDGVGCWRLLPSRLLRQLRRSGVLVRRFMVPMLQPIRGGSNLRNHRKLAVADGVHVWSGGRNLADEYFLPSSAGHPAWVDLSFKRARGLGRCGDGAVRGGLACSPRARRPVWLSPAMALGGGDQAWAQWLPSGPDHADDTLHALYLASAFHAQTSITL